MGNNQLICQECDQLEDDQPSFESPHKMKSKRTVSLIVIESNGSPGTASKQKSIKELEYGLYQIGYPDGSCFRGQMKEEKRQGQGIQIWKDNSSYQGAWKNDKGHGHGLLKTSNFEFQGQFQQNNIVKGKMIVINKRNQQFYDGQFKDFAYHGKGTLIVKGVSTYTGDFIKNRKQGKGKIIFQNGQSYEGDFKHGVMCGHGIFKCPDFEYVGQFYNGKIHGEGRCEWKNGSVYMGSYANGVKEGYGYYIYEDGKSYAGHWKDGQPFQRAYTFAKQIEEGP